MYDSISNLIPYKILHIFKNFAIFVNQADTKVYKQSRFNSVDSRLAKLYDTLHQQQTQKCPNCMHTNNKHKNVTRKQNYQRQQAIARDGNKVRIGENGIIKDDKQQVEMETRFELEQMELPKIANENMV